MGRKNEEDPLEELGRLIGKSGDYRRSPQDLEKFIESEYEPEVTTLACIHVMVNGTAYPMLRELTEQEWDRLEKLSTILTLQKVLQIP